MRGLPRYYQGLALIGSDNQAVCGRPTPTARTTRSNDPTSSESPCRSVASHPRPSLGLRSTTSVDVLLS